jgi:hypothetical protein
MNNQLPRLKLTTLGATALLALSTASLASAQSYKLLGWENDTSQISDNTTDGSAYAFSAGSSDASTVTTTPIGADLYSLQGDNVRFQTNQLRATAYPTTGNYIVNGTTIAAPGAAAIASRTPATPFVAVSSAFNGGGTWSSFGATAETFNGSGSFFNVLKPNSTHQAHHGLFQFDASKNTTFTLSVAGLAAITNNTGEVARQVSMTITDYQNNVTLAEVSNIVWNGTDAVAGITITFNNTLAPDTDAADAIVNYDFSKGLTSAIAIEVGYDNIVGTNTSGLITGNDFSVYNEFTLQAGFVAPSAVPEPSTYAAILGAIALGATAVKRRRRA